jgi:hypothetical protein
MSSGRFTKSSTAKGQHSGRGFVGLLPAASFLRATAAATAQISLRSSREPMLGA